MSASRPISRGSAERQVYPGACSCAGAATPRLQRSSPSFCGSSILGIRPPRCPPCSFFGALPRTRQPRIHPQLPQHCWAAFLGSETCFPCAQLLRCLALPAHPAALDKGLRSASPWPALQSESSPEPAGGWKKCELPAVRADKGPDECAAPPPEPGSLQRPRPPAPCSSLGPKQNLPLWRSPKQATFVSHSGYILFLFRVSEGQLAFGK